LGSQEVNLHEIKHSPLKSEQKPGKSNGAIIRANLISTASGKRTEIQVKVATYDSWNKESNE
jgi:hypothetical protein